jgi:hypothetical protein
VAVRHGHQPEKPDKGANMIRNAYTAARFAAVASAAMLVAAAGLLPAAAHAQPSATSEATAVPAITSDATAGTMIPQGTPVFVTLKQRLRSGIAKPGETITFAVTSDVRHGGAAAGTERRPADSGGHLCLRNGGRIARRGQVRQTRHAAPHL